MKKFLLGIGVGTIVGSALTVRYIAGRIADDEDVMTALKDVIYNKVNTALYGQTRFHASSNARRTGYPIVPDVSTIRTKYGQSTVYEGRRRNDSQ